MNIRCGDFGVNSVLQLAAQLGKYFIIRQGKRLNRNQIWRDLKPLVELKEEPDILTRLEQLFSKHSSF